MSDEDRRRTFTFEEARGLFPEVRERTRAAVEKIGALDVDVDEDDSPEERQEKLERAAGAILREWAGDLESLGLEVKGPWLVDFDSGGGYYCWKWPEPSIDYFHGYEEGFAGRVRLQ